MKKMHLSFLLLPMLIIALCSCGIPRPTAQTEATNPDPVPQESAAEESDQPPSASSKDNPISAPQTESEKPAEDHPASLKTATLYIGFDGYFKEYPVEYRGELTPDWLIAKISELTGWNLDLTEEVTSGKGGMTISFASSCALLAGPPDPQRDDFFVFDVTQLAETVLSSIQHTLQYNFVDPALGDPQNLDIYFSLEGKDIVIPNAGITISHTEPYHGIGLS